MRLSNKKAKSLLEFMCKSRLRAYACIVKFKPYFYEEFKDDMPDDVLSNVVFEVVWSDGKGCDKAVFESKKHSYNMKYLCFNRTCSWTHVVRYIEKKARSGSSFFVFSDEIFGPNDTIEETLVKMDLEEKL